MKIKIIIIIFIIAFCLLSFTDISCLAEEPVNWGEFWNSSSGVEWCRKKCLFDWDKSWI